LDTSLRRLGLDYVDIFYPATPLERGGIGTASAC
jgi:aryl-alcohol dehydrogenase-like predicted oxidoreductase